MNPTLEINRVTTRARERVEARVQPVGTGLVLAVALGLAASGLAQVPEQILKSFGNVSQAGSRPVGVHWMRCASASGRSEWILPTTSAPSSIVICGAWSMAASMCA